MESFLRFRVGDLSKDECISRRIIGGVLPLFNKGLLYTVNEELGLFDSLGRSEGYTNKPVENDLDNYLKFIDLAKIIELGAFSIYKGHMYFLVDAFSFLEDGSSSPFPNLTEDSNLVVVKTKLIIEFGYYL